MVNFELGILDMIQKIHSPILDQFMLFLTKISHAGIVWIVFIILLMINKKTRQAGYVAFLAMIINFVLCNVIIKPWVARIRPYEINTAVQLLVEKMHDYSFPSGHTTAGFATATALLLMKQKKLTIFAFILATLIAFSRLYLYVHFPTDVLGGMILGAICGGLGYGLYLLIGKMKRKQKTAKEISDK